MPLAACAGATRPLPRLACTTLQGMSEHGHVGMPAVVQAGDGVHGLACCLPKRGPQLLEALATQPRYNTHGSANDVAWHGKPTTSCSVISAKQASGTSK